MVRHVVANRTHKYVHSHRGVVSPSHPKPEIDALDFSTKALELEMPAPVAIPFARFNAETDPGQKVLRMFDALEAALSYLAILGLSEVLSRGLGSAELDEFMTDSFLRAPTLGSWLRLFKACARIVEKEPSSFFRQRPTAEGERDVLVDLADNIDRLTSRLLRTRNHYVHARQFSRPKPKQILGKQKTDFLHFLRSLGALRGYELVAARRVPAFENDQACEIVRFMGCSYASTWRSSYWIPSPAAEWPEGRPLLTQPSGRTLCLWPFLHCEFESTSSGSPTLYALVGRGKGELVPQQRLRYSALNEPSTLTFGPGQKEGAQWSWIKAESQRNVTPAPLSSLWESVASGRPRWEGQAVSAQHGTYTIGPRIAEGGMGSVYLATGDKRRCVKFVRLGGRADETVMRRFWRQVEILREWKDRDDIVTIVDAGRCTSPDGMECFLVMEWAEGGDLSQLLLRWGPVLPGDEQEVARRLELFDAVVGAVAFVHERGVVHRDLKPSNVLLDAHQRPILSDFDLVRRVEQDSQARLTSIGTPIGTPLYWAPEQEEARLDVSPTADVFALGLILGEFYMGSAIAPDLRKDRAQTLGRLEYFAGPRIRSLVDRCTRGSPAERFQDAAELRHKLRRVAGGAPSDEHDQLPPTPPPKAPELRSATRRRRRPATARREPSERDLRAAGRILKHLERGDFTRLNADLLRLSHGNRLSRAIGLFCEGTLRIKLDLTADNEATIEAQVTEALSHLTEPADLYTSYQVLLRPAVLSLASLLDSVARSGLAKAAIRRGVRQFASVQEDHTLLRELKEKGLQES